MTDKKLLSPDEFKKFFPMLGRSSIYDLLHAKRIRNFRVGRKIVIPASEIEDFPKREASIG